LTKTLVSFSVLICDTSGLLAYFNDREDDHAAVAAVVDVETGPLVVSPYVLAELDHLVTTRYGIQAELAVLGSLLTMAWQLVNLEEREVRQARDIIQRYHDQRIGLTDASLVALAARQGTNRILTLDHRHFRVVRTLSGEAFDVLPA
jgi:predicted nucleic acid-binding protein